MDPIKQFNLESVEKYRFSNLILGDAKYSRSTQCKDTNKLQQMKEQLSWFLLLLLQNVSIYQWGLVYKLEFRFFKVVSIWEKRLIHTQLQRALFTLLDAS